MLFNAPERSQITPEELTNVITNRPTPAGEYLGAVTRQSFDYSIPGTVYNEMQVPDDDRMSDPAFNRPYRGAHKMVRSDVPIMDEGTWKASPHYREAIPYDGRMTEARAKAKADYYDADQYNSWLRQNRAMGVGTAALATIGTLAGAAPDPTNYIPVFGPAFKVAAAGRAALILRRAGTQAVDAALMTAAVSPAIAQSRRSFGDDVGFADIMLDIGLSAALGGAFGGVVGWRERLPALNPKLVQESLQALGEGAEALSRGDAIDVGATRAAPAITAYHGSPHTFDRFSLSKINTGEGAQVFGHGLYFAENRGVANSYKSALSGQPFPDGDPRNGAWHFFNRDGEEAARNYLKQSLRAEEVERALGDVKSAQSGSLYETRLRVSKDDLLDWDKPLSEQSPQVQAALRKADKRTPKERAEIDALAAELGDVPDAPSVKTDYTGKQAYEELVDRLKSPEAASAALREAGIPGLKYLDQGSRNAGGWKITPPDQTVSGKWMVKSSDYNSKGLHFDTEAEARAALDEKIGGETRNFVIFDDGLVDIVARNDKPLDTSVAKDMPGNSPEMLARAEASIGKKADIKSTAEGMGVDHATGDFAELADIERLKKNDGLTQSELDSLKASDELMKTADNYAKAYEAAASCLARAA